MSFWIELHCDVRCEEADPRNLTRSLCWSNRNDNPAELFGSDVDGRFGVAEVKRIAVRQGFKRLRDGRWCCPGCATTLGGGNAAQG